MNGNQASAQFSLLITIATTAVTAGGIQLVKPRALGLFGKPSSDYSIYLDAAAPSTVKLAAEELQRGIEISTGIRLPISGKPAERMICLGNNAAARKAGLSSDSFPDDGFRIVTKGKHLYILGKDTKGKPRWRGWESRGTLFGTYEFLETVVGVRWLMPGEMGEEIPRHRRLSVPRMDVTQKPAFQIRELVDVQNQIRTYDPKDGSPTNVGPLQVDRWLLRHKSPNISDALKSTRRKIDHGHAWIHYITKKDMAAHPEFEAVSGSKGKFCTSNRDAVKLFAKRVILWLDEHPDRWAAPISPEDGGNFCKCETCRTFTEKDWHGRVSHTRLILKFYNDVADIVALKHPDRILGGYIYYNYMYPPSGSVKMHPNVWLFMAQLNYYGWGLAKPVYREEIGKLIQAWKAVTPNLYYFSWSVWFRSFNGTPLPPGRPILKLELPTLYKHGVKGAGVVGIGAWGYGGCENYILAKLFWNAEADVDALYREWMQKAYGPAWKTMDKFVTMIEERVLERKRAEHPRYSGDNYEINYDFVEQVYKPIFPEMERLYLQAISQTETAKQRKRLEMLGDNLVMLHYNLRKAEMVENAEDSVFFRDDESYLKFLDDTVYSLSLYRDHGHRDVPLLYQGSFSSRAENPPMELRKVSVARIPAGAASPVVDGALTDQAWKTAGVADAFRQIGRPKPVGRQTSARVLYDRTSLYLGFESTVEDVKRIPVTVTERDDNVFIDDSVEIFLAVFPNARQKYWHLALNAGNTQWDGIIKTPRQDLDWKSATGRTKKAWTAEIVIPFKSLGLAAPPTGTTWSANFGRTERPPNGGVVYSSWNAVYRGFLESSSFGKLVFEF
ncbi:MAG: DUF4838 domain-containing protein [Planctomycetota bacterium]|nr:DUF4838 domain-containing protein [Planctomycetota bacterium]